MPSTSFNGKPQASVSSENSRDFAADADACGLPLNEGSISLRFHVFLASSQRLDRMQLGRAACRQDPRDSSDEQG